MTTPKDTRTFANVDEFDAHLAALAVPDPSYITNICDDCGKVYTGPPYYTFETETCRDMVMDPITGDEIDTDHDCTGNMCPDCAGPFLEPDTDGDPRRVPVDFYDEKMHAHLLREHGTP